MNGLLVLAILLTEVVMLAQPIVRDWSFVTRVNVWLDRQALRLPWLEGPPLAAVQLGLPLLAAWLMGRWLAGLPGVLEFPLSLAVVYFSVGPINALASFDGYSEALVGSDVRGAARAAGELADSGLGTALYESQVSGDGVPVADPEQTARVFVWASFSGLFGVLFFTYLLGPFGAVLTRLFIIESADEAAADPLTRRLARRGLDVLMYVPGRIFALGAALAGSFAHVLSAWQIQDDLSLAATRDTVVHTAMAGARYGHLEEAVAGDPELVWLRGVRALVTRVCAIWGGLVLLALVF